MSNSYEIRRLKYLSDKFGIAGRLELAGKDEVEPKEKTLQSLVNEKERDAQKNYLLATASTNYRGRKMTVYYDKSRAVKFVF